jgi:hypothetical protein
MQPSVVITPLEEIRRPELIPMVVNSETEPEDQEEPSCDCELVDLAARLEARAAKTEEVIRTLEANYNLLLNQSGYHRLITPNDPLK